MKNQLLIIVGLFAIILTQHVIESLGVNPQDAVCTCGLGLQSSPKESLLNISPVFDGHTRKYSRDCDPFDKTLCQFFCSKLVKNIGNNLEFTYEPDWNYTLPAEEKVHINKSLGQILCEQNLEVDISKNPDGETVVGKCIFHCPKFGKTDVIPTLDTSADKLTCKKGMFTQPLREKPEPDW